ncbi:hypothetical protein PFISCL1PPCAC_27085, partial [Pristionchus fissidentatus]
LASHLQLFIMSSVNLSLDEIIAKSRANKGRGRGQDSSFKSDGINGRRGGNNGGARRSGGGGGQRREGAFSRSVPGGKWRHDKFSEAEGGRGGSAPSAPRGGLATAISANKKVRVNVSNLAASVTTADLEELFSQYSIDSAAVHYAEGGEHLGTGDVVMKKRDAQRALTDFQGVSVDGSRLSMAIVEGGAGGGSIFDRVQVVKKVAGGGITKRSRDDARPQRSQRPRGSSGGRHPLDRTDEEGGNNKGGRGGGRGGPNRGGRREAKPKTEAELDAELDSYMKKSHSTMEM